MSARKAPSPRSRTAAAPAAAPRGTRREGATPAGKGRARTAGRGAAAPSRWSAEAVAEVVLWALVLLPPLLVATTAKEAFRLPKLMASEWLGLASLLPLAWKLRGVERVGLADLRRPAIAAVLPLLAVATLGLAWTEHPLHVRQAVADLWIGAACLAGWSLGLPRVRLERLLAGLLAPASLLALVGILQFHRLWNPFRFQTLAAGERLAVTSTAGNPGDLAAYLVLPCLAAQWLLARGARGASRLFAALALALCLYALAVTQTLAAAAAVAAGSLALWLALLPRRRALAVLGAAAAAALLLVALVAPLRSRVAQKARQVAAGEWNLVLTGRLDGWRAAAWMLERHPAAGVGHGAYRAEFVPAKLALLAEGKEFLPGDVDVHFANAHNEALEVAADLGLPGLAALGWALGVLVAALARRRRAGRVEGAFAWAGAAALAVLSLAHFPFRIALVAFPALLFLAWVLRDGAAAGETGPEPA